MDTAEKDGRKVTPLEFLEAIYCNEGVPLSVRMRAAIEAAPYVHATYRATAGGDARAVFMDIVARRAAAKPGKGSKIGWEPMWEEYVPKTAILIWSVVLSCGRFENQRWIRARTGGLQGSSAGFGFFIDATGLIALVFAITIAALSLYDFGWRKTAGLVVLTLLGGWCWAAIGAFVAAVVGQLPLWLVGTVLVYVAAIMLFFQFSWFGFF